MEYGASAEDVARVCHAHPVRLQHFITNIFQLNSLNFLNFCGTSHCIVLV